MLNTTFYSIWQKIDSIPKSAKRISELSLNANDSNSGITVVIFGSLAGRTSSISYSPLLKMLESLRSEFKLEPSYSFLFTPEAFHKAYQRRCSEEGCEHVFNFLSTTSEVERYFREIDGAFKPTQFLVDKLCACLKEYTEDLCECEIIKKIVGLINLDPQTVSYDDELEIWVSKFGFVYSRAIEYVFSIQMLGLFKRLFSDLTIQTESLNPINVSYNDLFANLDRSKADPVVIVPKVVLPSTPASVSIKAEGKKAIRINWTAPKTSGTGKVLNYEIYRNGKKIATVSASARTLLDRNLDSRQSYTYRIVTVGSQGKSIKSPYTRAILPGSWAYRLVLYLRKR